MAYLTVPIAAKNTEEGCRQIKAAKVAGAEMLELRTDYLDNLGTLLVGKLIAEAKADKPLPIIVTCRDVGQGGARKFPDQLRVEMLVCALKAGAEFVDFEYEKFLVPQNQEPIKAALAESSKGRLILSAHNFKTKFDNIIKLRRHIETLYPAAIPKLVYTANHINDCFEAFDLLRGTGNERIIFCMGAAGLMSRIIAKKLGSFVTFASLDTETATAPGQLSIEQFKKIYRHAAIQPDTDLYGIIGSPVAHSLSPAVHNACFADAKVNKIYLPLLLEGGREEFEQFINRVLNRPWLGFRGFSVTIPHKQNALDYVRAKQGFIEPLAKRIGAVNTILISADGVLSAYNTDCAGALDAITSTLGIDRTQLHQTNVAVIGAGGVARAIVAGLSDAGAKIKIYNRTVEKGQKLAAEFNCDFMPLEDLRNLKTQLLINCTSIGMHPDTDATPVPKECLKRNMAVFDTVYNPAQTLLLKQAKEKRAKTIDGVTMFINQALAQFKLFTSRDANPKLMQKTIRNRLSGKKAV